MESSEHKVDASARHEAATMLRLYLAGSLGINEAFDSWPRQSRDRAVRMIGEALWDFPPTGVTEQRQLHDEWPRSLRRFALFLESDQQVDASARWDRRTAPFRDREALEAARARCQPTLPLDRVYCAIDRKHRDRGAELLGEYLKRRMTVEELRAAWPVPAEDLERAFSDDALRDIHRRFLKVLPAGTLEAGERLREVVERCHAFLQTDHIWFARAWPRESFVVLAAGGLWLFLGAMSLVVAVTHLISAFRRGLYESDGVDIWLCLFGVFSAGAGACFIAEHVSGRPLRRKIRRALLTGHLKDWPFPARDLRSLTRMEGGVSDDGREDWETDE